MCLIKDSSVSWDHARAFTVGYVCLALINVATVAFFWHVKFRAVHTFWKRSTVGIAKGFPVFTPRPLLTCCSCFAIRLPLTLNIASCTPFLFLVCHMINVRGVCPLYSHTSSKMFNFRKCQSFSVLLVNALYFSCFGILKSRRVLLRHAPAFLWLWICYLVRLSSCSLSYDQCRGVCPMYSHTSSKCSTFGNIKISRFAYVL